MDAKVTWRAGLSFTGTTGSGFEMPLGVSKADGGADDGARPLELFLVGLAGCTGMDVISILGKKKQDVTAFEVRAHAERATEHPKVFTHIVVEYVITGRQVERAAAERAVELSMTKYCPAHDMLKKAVTIESKITLRETA
ncbi:MAG: osmotically inducible protein OsmC [Chloroflexi bacterium RBG_16_56_8]|nr:MAG: osmotically inducible protein OsmC [Chloroflexi bacterium RBG_16_56_8]